MLVKLFIYFWLPGSSCHTGLSLAAESGGYSPVAVHGLLFGVASPVAGHRLQGMQASAVAAPGL